MYDPSCGAGGSYRAINMLLAHMCYNQAMSDGDSDSHVPPHLIYLAKQLARECSGPGIYNIKLTVPAHSASSYAIEIGRYERMRRVSFGRERGGGVPQVDNG